MNISNLKSNNKMPKHIAFIIDGNGRWAKKRGLARSLGHKAGLENLKKNIQLVQDLGIKNLSLYCFSKENWNRPIEEVNYLMQLFNQVLDEVKAEYVQEDKNVRVLISGDMEDEKLSPEIRTKAKEIMELTKNKTGFILNACINYGGRQEILKAINEIVESGERNIDVASFEKHLYTADMLPLDFVIRTSGECRTSNFMPWQTTYSEWYFPKVYWPAFTRKHLIKALKIYTTRNRRFGAIKSNSKG